MARFKKIRNWLPYTVSLLFILLFVYAAVSKLVDYENFRVQLGQSPLFTAYAHIVALAVPTVEIIIAGFLFFPKYRLWGLYASFTLMVMFTAYIVIILNYSSYIPCSCGGVLENLDWTEHLFFNIGLIIFAFLAIIFYNPLESSNLKKIKIQSVKHMAVLASIGSGLVIVPFLGTKKNVIARDDFIRSFQQPMHLEEELDVNFNSYYFSGSDSDFIYLGNVTAPLLLTLVTTDLKHKKEIQLTLENPNFTFNALKTVVFPPYFYLYDGTVPCLYKGRLGEWKARLQPEPPIRFSLLVPMKTDRFAIRSIIPEPRGHTLGVMEYQNGTVRHRRFEGGLPSQGNSIFDCDGILTYNASLDRAVYTFYYRNQFMHFSHEVDTLIFGNTIDSTTQAGIELVKLKEGITKMSKPPKFVNKYTSTIDRFLLVRSKIMGQNDSYEMWGKAAIIDVYDLKTHKYRFSFYIQNSHNILIKEFTVQGNKLYTLADQYLRSHTLEMGWFR